MVERSVMIPYLKCLHLLCFDLIIVLEFALEMCMCLYPKVLFHRLYLLQRKQSAYVGPSGYSSVCESRSHTEKMLTERSQKQKGLLIRLFPEQWWDIWWTQAEPDIQ